MSEQSLANRVVQEKLRLLLGAVEQSSEGIAITDMEGMFLFVNRAFAEQHGYNAVHLVGRNMSVLHRPQDIGAAELAKHQARTTGTFVGECCHIRPDGTVFPALMTISLLRDENSNPIGMIATIRDITETKKAENKLNYRIDFEDLIMGISTRFINLPPDEVDSGIDHALKEIGEFADVDRSYAVLLSDERAKIQSAYEWCDEGIASHLNQLKAIPLDDLTWLMNKLTHSRILHVPLIKDLPPADGAEKNFFLAQDIQSLVLVPMVYGESAIGFLGFDSVGQEKVWSEDIVSLLRIVGEIFINALHRKQMNEELRRAREELEIRVQQRTSELRITNEQLTQEIADRKLADRLLQESEERYRRTLDSMMEGCQIIGFDWRYVYVNDAVAKQAHRTKAQLLGRLMTEEFPGIDTTHIFEVMKNCMEKRISHRMENEFTFPDGTKSWFELSIQPVPEGIFILSNDINSRKLAEQTLLDYQEQLRSLASESSLAEEHQRRGMASELHDRIGQSLFAAKIKLGALQETAASEPIAPFLKEIYALIGQSIYDTQSLTFELGSPILYKMGLEAALRALTRQMQDQHGIEAEFHVDKQPKSLEDDARIVLYQSVRELLYNVAKHAQAKKVKVSLTRTASAVQVRVEDDGIGFDTSTLGLRRSAGGGFGLFSIRERLTYLGGDFKINSQPGSGTCVILKAPVKRKE
jgi:PAS domain S-box-containing protein